MINFTYMTQFFKLDTMIILIFLFSCANVKRNEVIGTYQARNNVNTIDTLKIFENSKYERSLYRKVDKSLIYKHEGNWHFENGMITLKKFFIDYDKEYSIDKGGFKESSMNCTFEVEIIFGRVYVGEKLSGVYLYEKL